MTANRSRRDQQRRRGFGLIELAVAGTLILVAMTATVQVVGWVALERKAVERRGRALLEAENLLERLMARPWSELTTESARQIKISSTTAAFLRKPGLVVKVTAFDDVPARKKVAVEIVWNDRSGQPEAPVRLAAWVFKKGEADR